MRTSPPNWSFMLTDLNGGVLGELVGADDRQVVLPLNRIPTAGFSIRADHALGGYFLDTSFDGLVKCYRDGTLVYIGHIVSSEEAYDTSTQVQKIAVTTAGPLWQYQYRMLGTTSAGYSYASTASPANFGTMFSSALGTINGTSPSSTGHDDPYSGIDFGTSSVTTSGAMGVFYFKPFAEALAETSVGAFDFEVVPVEPSIPSGRLNPHIGTLNMYDVLGTSKPQVVFEFGTPGANLSTYSRVIDRANLANIGYIQQPAASDHSGILSITDDASAQARSWYEALIDDGGVEWDVLRLNLVEKAVTLRSVPRQVITIQPRPLASYSALDDFVVGDSVQVRSVLNNKTVLDTMTRIWGVTFSIDRNGNETQELQTVEES